MIDLRTEITPETGARTCVEPAVSSKISSHSSRKQDDLAQSEMMKSVIDEGTEELVFICSAVAELDHPRSLSIAETLHPNPSTGIG